MKWMKVSILAVLITVGLAPVVSAQNLVANPLELSAYGLKIPVWNATDSTITDGSVVMVDTTATTAYINSKRPVVRNYNGTLSNRFRVIGLAVGPIKKSSQGGNGSVLIWGYHPRAIIAVSNAGALAPLKVGAVNGSLSVADSVSMAVGYLVGNNATLLTGPRYTARVWWTGMGGKIVGAL